MIDLISLADGSNVPQINHKDIEPLSFPVAPLPEQHRIVAKIEELFTELDAGIESLKKAQAQLKQYRQSVLKAAVEGKLTEEWRAAHKDELEPASVLLERIQKERREKWEAEQLESFAAKGKTPKDDKWKGKYEESMTPDMESFPKLPDVWKWTSIGALFGTSYGLSERLSKTEPDNELDVPVLRIPNVTEFGTLDLSNLKYFPLEKPKRDKLSVKKGDILFNWRNAPKWIGRSAVFDRDGEFVNASFLLKLRPCSVGYSNFISLYLNYLRISGYFLTRIDNAVNQANFNASKTRQIEVALPPLTEQVEIIKVVERCFSLADNLDDTIGMELERAQRLRQSILKQAFSGKLVPQDPNDEPASVLLERIKAEKAVREAENKRARKSKAKPKKEPKQMELL